MPKAGAVPGVAFACRDEDASWTEGVPTGPGARPGLAAPLSTRGLLSILYEDLKSMASRLLTRETRGWSMEATELVHESFLKLQAQSRTMWQGKTHFMAVSAQAMRRILIDDARTRTRKKRGGKGRTRVELLDHHAVSHDGPDALLIVDEIVSKLTDLDPVHARILKLRVFEGLAGDEIAEILGVSSRTIERHWAMIRAWTLRELAVGLPD